jgi:hypothetical protein
MTEEEFISVNRRGRPLVDLEMFQKQSNDQPRPKCKGILVSVGRREALIHIHGRNIRKFELTKDPLTGDLIESYEHGSKERGGGFKVVDVSQLLAPDELGVSMQGRSIRSL